MFTVRFDGMRLNFVHTHTHTLFPLRMIDFCVGKSALIVFSFTRTGPIIAEPDNNSSVHVEIAKNGSTRPGLRGAGSANAQLLQSKLGCVCVRFAHLQSVQQRKVTTRIQSVHQPICSPVGSRTSLSLSLSLVNCCMHCICSTVFLSFISIHFQFFFDPAAASYGRAHIGTSSGRFATFRAIDSGD